MKANQLHTVAGLLLAMALLVSLAGNARTGPRQAGALASIGGAGYVIAGGGGTSSGGSYTLTVVIGQPALGTLTGGAFSLEAGFLTPFEAPTPSPTPIPSPTPSPEPPSTAVYLPLLAR
jgi:hypothetical protein